MTGSNMPQNYAIVAQHQPGADEAFVVPCLRDVLGADFGDAAAAPNMPPHPIPKGNPVLTVWAGKGACICGESGHILLGDCPFWK